MNELIPVYYRVIEIGCEAYITHVGSPGWIHISNEIYNPFDAYLRCKELNENRIKMGVGHMFTHIITKSTESHEHLMERIRNSVPGFAYTLYG